jgi:hypothetical protein
MAAALAGAPPAGAQSSDPPTTGPQPQFNLLSTGPTDPNNTQFGAYFRGASRDGTHVFFITMDQLVSEDRDASYDLYERFGGDTRLVTTGPALGDQSNDNRFAFVQATPDGERVLFSTADRLVAEDTDGLLDVYERVGGTTPRLVSPDAGSLRLAPRHVTTTGGSRDLDHVLVHTTARLVATDLDDQNDVYLRSSGRYRLVSTGLIGGNGAFGARGIAVSDAADRVVFKTKEQLVPDDLDSADDLYVWTPNGTELLSTGPGPGNADTTMEHLATTADGRRTIWQTFGSLPSTTPTKG